MLKRFREGLAEKRIIREAYNALLEELQRDGHSVSPETGKTVKWRSFRQPPHVRFSPKRNANIVEFYRHTSAKADKAADLMIRAHRFATSRRDPHLATAQGNLAVIIKAMVAPQDIVETMRLVRTASRGTAGQALQRDLEQVARIHRQTLLTLRRLEAAGIEIPITLN